MLIDPFSLGIFFPYFRPCVIPWLSFLFCLIVCCTWEETGIWIQDQTENLFILNLSNNLILNRMLNWCILFEVPSFMTSQLSFISLYLCVFFSPKFFSFTETKDGYTVIVEDNLYSGTHSLNSSIRLQWLNEWNFHCDMTYTYIITQALTCPCNNVKINQWLFPFPTELPQGESIDVADPIWRVLTVSAGALGSHKLTGISKIVKTVISPLADNNISVLIISTYQSDYVLVSILVFIPVFIIYLNFNGGVVVVHCLSSLIHEPLS